MKRSELENYLEQECYFRDYRILPIRLLDNINRTGMHYIVTDIKRDVQHALSEFSLSDCPIIYFYIDNKDGGDK